MSDLWGLGEDLTKLGARKAFDPLDDHYFPGYHFGPASPGELDDDDATQADMETAWLIGEGSTRRKPHIQRGVEQGPAHPGAPLTDTERWLQGVGHDFATHIHQAEPSPDPLYRGMAVPPEWLDKVQQDGSVSLPLSSFTPFGEMAYDYSRPDPGRGWSPRKGHPVILKVEPGSKSHPINDDENVSHGDFDLLGMHTMTDDELGGEYEADRQGHIPTTVVNVRQRSVPAPFTTHTASTDGIRYAHLVEADVAEDLMKLGMPYYHYTDQEFAPGDKLKPATQTDPSGARSKWGDGHDLYDPSKVYFTWRDGDPGHDEYTDPNSVYGPNAYEVEPVGEIEDDPEKEPAREWHLDNLGRYESGDLGHDDYMAPNAIVKRKIDAPQVAKDHAEQMRNKHGLHDRIAMPAPLPKGITFTPFGPGDKLHREVAEKHNMDAYAELWDRMSGVAAHHNGEPVGHLVWFHPGVTDTVRGKPVDISNEVGSIQVRDDMQHHSVATGMWDYARSLNPDLRHSPVKTQDGRGWADYEQSRQKTAMPAPLPKGTYFRYHPELVWSPGVTAHAPGGKMVGSLEWYDDDHIMCDLGTRKPGEIDRIQVPEDQRGQSIATSMFDFAKQHEPRLHHSDQLTPDGEGWSQYEQSRHARLAAPRRRFNQEWQVIGGDYMPIDAISHYMQRKETGFGDEKSFYNNDTPLSQKITDQGYEKPVELITDGKSGSVYDGHHRIDVARQLGHTHVPVQVTWRVPDPVWGPGGAYGNKIEPWLKGWLTDMRGGRETVGRLQP